MPPRFSYGIFSRNTSFFVNHIKDVLKTESISFLIRPSESLQAWKYQNLALCRALSSSCGLDSSSTFKKGSLYFSCPVENKVGINRGVTRSSNLSYPHEENRSFNVYGSSCERSPSRVADIKDISFKYSKPTPFLSREYSKVSMHGWNFSFDKTRSSEDWSRVWSDGRRTHMGHAHDHDGHEEKAGAYGDKVLRWGLWTDMSLTVFKGAAGYISGSTAIIADAAHSASDIVLSGVALWTSRASSAPPDKQHPYGHGKIETMGALAISGLLLATGGGIAWNAVDTLQVMLPAMLGIQDTVQTTVDTVANLGGHSHDDNHGHGGHTHGLDMEHMGVALLAAIVSIGAKEGLYWVTKAAGEKAGSALLTASAWHHRSDAISSIVALIGVGGAMMGVTWLDPVAALLVSGMIAKAGLETGYQSMQELLDMGLSESVLAPIRKTAFEVDGVEGIHQLRGRRMGSTVHVDVHIEVDPWLSVSAAHNIGEAVRQQLRTHHANVTESFVHIDPADGRPTSVAPGELEVETVAAAEHYDDDHLRSDQHSSGHRYDNNTHGHSHVKNHVESSANEEIEEDEHMRDLTGVGRKSDNFAWDGTMSRDGREAFHDNVGTLRQSEVERCVRNVLYSNFREVVQVKEITCHFLHGNVVAEVGVSLDPKLSIRDAMQHASDMETRLLRDLKDLSAVSLHLNLSNNDSLAQRV